MTVNRRTLLRGAVASSIVPATYGRVRSRGDRTERAPRDDASEPISDGSGVLVRIADATDPVAGAGLLEVTAELENATDRTARPTVEYFVDGESVGNVTLTLEPGETRRPFPASHRVEPADEDRDVTVRVEAAGGSAARTVTVRGVDELGDGLTRPNAEIAVQPGASVLLEAGAVDPDASQTTAWWVDGESVGESTASPWQSIYYAERNAHYWQYTADAEGDHEVTAGIESEAGNYRADWTVTVTPNGHAPPTIEAARPARGSLPVDHEGTTDLALEVADPDGALDRVVWWVSQVDRLLGVSGVSGATDTASLTIEGGLPQRCPIVAWVIADDGTIASERVWTVGSADGGAGGDAGVTVSIAGTNDPVDAGDVLEVTATLENAGDRSVTQAVELLVGHDPTLVDTQHVSIDGGESKTAILEFETAVVANDQSFPVRVETVGSTAEQSETVRGTDGS
ncbi:hypothetical protein [Natrinema marinum]|uniref:hypothetical protein n=1 Tax=Natrinema marinum TaxID=2961598 RepID=UPI0020C8C78F|nr:hypothetical protein [Natrinema marinum]